MKSSARYRDADELFSSRCSMFTESSLGAYAAAARGISAAARIATGFKNFLAIVISFSDYDSRLHEETRIDNRT
jgi:hypothetical protein